MKLPWVVSRRFLVGGLAAGFCLVAACSKGREVQIGSFKAEIPSIGEMQDSYWDLVFEPSKRVAHELLLASKAGNEEMVEEILALRDGMKSEVPVMLTTEAKDEKGWTPLLWAVHYNHEGIAEKLLMAGANPNTRGDDGATALALAVRNNNEDIMDLLLRRYPVIDGPDLEGNTPLMLAAASNHLDLVEELVRRGADPRLRNAKGDSAIKIARERGSWRIARELLGDTEWKTIVEAEDDFLYDLSPQMIQRVDADSRSAWLRRSSAGQASSPARKASSGQKEDSGDPGPYMLMQIKVQCRTQEILEVKKLHRMADGRNREEEGTNQWEAVVPGTIGVTIASEVCAADV